MTCCEGLALEKGLLASPSANLSSSFIDLVRNELRVAPAFFLNCWYDFSSPMNTWKLTRSKRVMVVHARLINHLVNGLVPPWFKYSVHNNNLRPPKLVCTIWHLEVSLTFFLYWSEGVNGRPGFVAQHLIEFKKLKMMDKQSPVIKDRPNFEMLLSL